MIYAFWYLPSLLVCEKYRININAEHKLDKYIYGMTFFIYSNSKPKKKKFSGIFRRNIICTYYT